MAERDEPDVVVAGAPVASPADADRSTPADASTATDPTATALAPLRARIDAIDQEIVTLLNERAQIALEIGRVKQVTGRRSVRDARREAQVIEHVTSVSAGLFPEPELVALYRKLIAATRRVQHAQRRQASDEASQAPVDCSPRRAGRPTGSESAAEGGAPDPPPEPR